MDNVVKFPVPEVLNEVDLQFRELEGQQQLINEQRKLIETIQKDKGESDD
jgi:hypothetical protein|tara:strand:- start:731 stop:880 length:150 start_codon:yes stop_codon:yes gene_type:complete